MPAKTGSHPLGGVRLQLNPGDTLKIRLVNKLPPIPDAKHLADNPDADRQPDQPAHPRPDRRAASCRRAERSVWRLRLRRTAQSGQSGQSGPRRTCHGGRPCRPRRGTPRHGLRIGRRGLCHPDPGQPPLGPFLVPSARPWRCAEPGDRGHVRDHHHRHARGHVRQRGMRLPGPRRQRPSPDTEGHRRSWRTTPSTRRRSRPSAAILRPVRRRASARALREPPPITPAGSWVHTVNGQVYPSIQVGPAGDIWRIVNSSGSRSYDLWMGDDATNAPVLMQVLAIDGVAIDSLALNAGGQDAMAKLLGGKVRPVPCPGPTAGSGPAGLCTTHLRLMPSSRAEVRVVGQKSASATLRTASLFHRW